MGVSCGMQRISLACPRPRTQRLQTAFRNCRYGLRTIPVTMIWTEVCGKQHLRKAEGPIAAVELLSDSFLAKRFPVKQKNKVRPIDDYKAKMAIGRRRSPHHRPYRFDGNLLVESRTRRAAG